MSSTCCVCNSQLIPPIIVCNCCCKMFHYPGCAGITDAESSLLDSNQSNIVFFCKDCKNGGGIKQTFVDSFTKISNELNCFTLTFGSLENTCQVISNNKNEIDNLKNKVIPDLSVRIDSLTNTNLNDSSIIREVEERLIKRNNVILYNMVDSNNLQDDFSKISNIFAQLGISITINNISRCGKYVEDAEHCRPLLVKLNSPQEADIVISNKKAFSTIEVNVNKDKTLNERTLYKKAVNELNTRKEKGELKLTIKNINGVPTVVEGNSSKRKAGDISSESNNNTGTSDDNNNSNNKKIKNSQVPKN